MLRNTKDNQLPTSVDVQYSKFLYSLAQHGIKKFAEMDHPSSVALSKARMQLINGSDV